MLSHRNILARSAGTAQMNGFTADEVSLNWFPLDHVGGVVMFHLRDVYLGSRQIHAPTEMVLEEPLRWLDWIDRDRVTLTWAPNFAFGLINDRLGDQLGDPAEEVTRRRWDLSSLRFILNAGEAIVARTSRRFLELLAPQGLRGDANHPAWGMSETSSAVTYSELFSLGTTADSEAFVEVGAPIPGSAIRIVDGEDRVVPEGTIGRLQVRGLSVTRGYYERPDLNRESFTADGWFKTGDLGRMRAGRLTITGREKDVIIIHGANYYSHEIESVVEEVAGVVVSFTAACAVRSPGRDTDELAIFSVPRRRRGRRSCRSSAPSVSGWCVGSGSIPTTSCRCGERRFPRRGSARSSVRSYGGASRRESIGRWPNGSLCSAAMLTRPERRSHPCRSWSHTTSLAEVPRSRGRARRWRKRRGTC